MPEFLDAGFVAFIGDYAAIFLVFALTAWFAYVRGVGYVLAATIALPFALVLYQLSFKALGVSSLVGASGTDILRVGVYGLLLVLAFMLVSGAVKNKYDGAFGPIQALAASISFTIATLVVWHQLPPFESVWIFKDLIRMVFSQVYAFWWLAASLILFYFSTKV